MQQSSVTQNGVENNKSVLWLGWLVVVGAWAVQLFLSYGVVEWYCQDTSVARVTVISSVLHGIAWFCLAVVIGIAVIYWRKNHAIRRQRQSEKSLSVLFIVRGGLALSVFLAVTILVQSLPNYFLNPCG
jgi:hypothetical protein